MSTRPPSPAPTAGDIPMIDGAPAAGGPPTFPSSSGAVNMMKFLTLSDSSLGSACDGPGDDGESSVVDATTAEIGGKVKVTSHLCAVFCDMLFDAPKSSFDDLWYSCPTFVAVYTKCNWNEKKSGKILITGPWLKTGLSALAQFDCVCFVLVEDTLTIDLRAKCAVDAIRDFKNDLIYCSRILCLLYPIRCLNVIVGCKEHGVGKGKLKQAVIDVLAKEKDLKWKEEFAEGSVISIELDFLEMEVHASDEKVDIFPCTAICDFLFDLPKSSFDRIWYTCPRLEAELYKCCRDEEIFGEKLYGRYFLVENTLPVDLRANSAVDAVEVVKRHLYFCSLLFAISRGRSLRCLDFIVGCRVHGVGKGKLKQKVLDVLEMEDDLEWSEGYAGGSVISLKLDGRQNFNFLLGENVVLPSFITRLLT